MSYCLVINATIDAEGGLPASARRLDTREWVMGLATAPVELQQACGWYTVVDTPQPTPAAGDTVDRSVQLVAGVPTVVWTERPMTAAELAAQTANTNQRAIVTNLASDLVNMQTIIDTTNTSIIVTTLAQAQQAARDSLRRDTDIARMLRRLGRLASNDLSGSS